LNTSEHIYGGIFLYQALPKSVTRTLRLDDDVDAGLEKMAEERGESVNAIAGRALRKLVEWDRLAESAGLVAVSSMTLGRLMDSQTPEQASAIGEFVGNEVWKPIIISRYGEINLESVLKSIELIARYMGRFDLIYSTEGSKRVVTIRHAGGIKWSNFYLGAATPLFSQVIGPGFNATATEELLSIEFDVPEGKEKIT
jgi:predicted transcriptional regulator